jgi:peptidoglycan-associated lipoprotein
MRKVVPVLTVVALAVVSATGCGRHKVITSQLDALSNKVESMGQSLEQTQERTRQNEARIGTVDTRAGAAQTAADRAAQAATAADARAGSAGDAARAAAASVTALERKLVYSATFSAAEGGFAFNKSELPDAIKAKLDDAVARTKADPKGAYFDVEGHTDNIGTPDANKKVGQDRADSVKRYLYEKHQIPLYRINSISYGPDKPVGDNKTRDGRAQNRRVEIKVWQ